MIALHFELNRKRRSKYTNECKLRAIRMTRDDGHSAQYVAQKLGVPRRSVSLWLTRAERIERNAQVDAERDARAAFLHSVVGEKTSSEEAAAVDDDNIVKLSRQPKTQYSAALKWRAIQMVRDGQSTGGVARELGIQNRQSLNGWLARADRIEQQAARERGDDNNDTSDSVVNEDTDTVDDEALPTRQSFSVAQKLEAIDLLKTGLSQAEVSRRLGVKNQGSIGEWMRREDKLRDSAAAVLSNDDADSVASDENDVRMIAQC